jgi:hypothetical protein
LSWCDVIEGNLSRIQGIDFIPKLTGIFEAAVDAGEANIRHRMQATQVIHDALPYLPAGDFIHAQIGDSRFDVIAYGFQAGGRDGELGTGVTHTSYQLAPIEFLSAPVVLDNQRQAKFYLFVRREARAAVFAFPSAAGGFAVLKGTAVQNP